MCGLQQDWKISKDLSFASVEIDKNCWLTLPRWESLCHSLARDQPQPGSFFQRPREAEKRDPGNEVDLNFASFIQQLNFDRMVGSLKCSSCAVEHIRASLNRLLN